VLPQLDQILMTKEYRFDLFDDVPGPSPWCLLPTTRTVTGFCWRSAGETELAVGKTLLVGANGPVGILDFQNYALMLDTSSLLIWHQKQADSGPSHPVRLFVIQPGRLSPLGENLDCLYEKMKGDQAPIMLGGTPLAEMHLETQDHSKEERASFPEQLHSVDELLILCECSGINPTVKLDRGNLALLVARPRRGTYRLYPQDWYNSGVFDRSYSWVTRVVRNPRTGQVHGEGVRMPPFILDGSLR
jgi:hypothetical protein